MCNSDTLREENEVERRHPDKIVETQLSWRFPRLQYLLSHFVRESKTGLPWKIHNSFELYFIKFIKLGKIVQDKNGLKI